MRPLHLSPFTPLQATGAVLIAALAVPLGALTATTPRFATGLVAAAVALAVLVSCPAWMLPAICLAGSVAVPTVIYEAQYRGSRYGSTPLAGQARWLLCVVAVVMVRWTMAKASDRHRLPPLALRALTLFGSAIAVAVATAAVGGRVYGGIGSDLYRQLSYPAALIIGVFSVTRTTGERERARVYAGVALVTCAAAAAAVGYWLWVTGRAGALPGMRSIFSLARAHSVFESRSVYPFLQDSPNGEAVELAMLTALCAPPLVAAGVRKYRHLALVLLVLAALAVLATQSRTGVVALLAAPLPWLVMASNSQQRRRALLVAVAAVVVGVSAHQVFPSTRGLTLHSGTFVARQSIWKQAVGRFADHPAFGMGYHFSARPNFIDSQALLVDPSAGPQSIEDEYLGQLIDGGVVGAALFAGVLAIFFGCAVRLSRVPGFVGSEGLGYFGLLVALCVGMVSTAALQSALVSTVCWMFFGVAAALVQARPSQSDAGTRLPGARVDYVISHAN